MGGGAHIIVGNDHNIFGKEDPFISTLCRSARRLPCHPAHETLPRLSLTMAGLCVKHLLLERQSCAVCSRSATAGSLASKRRNDSLSEDWRQQVADYNTSSVRGLGVKNEERFKHPKKKMRLVIRCNTQEANPIAVARVSRHRFIDQVLFHHPNHKCPVAVRTRQRTHSFLVMVETTKRQNDKTTTPTCHLDTFK